MHEKCCISQEPPQDTAPENHVIRCSKDMGMTQEEFFRTLSVVLAGRAYTRQQDTVYLREGERSMVITVSRGSDRRLGLLCLPRVEVVLTFTGYTPPEVEQFLQHFSTHFQRGGG